jgi:hypothetical protein
MTGMTTLTRQNLLQYVTAKAAMPALATPGSVWLALFTVVGTDAGTGFTEVSTGSYARVLVQAANINAAGSAIPCTISNSGTLSFPASTASWGNIIAWGIYDAVTAGNLLYWDFFGNDPWYPFTVTLASPGVITAIGITAGSTPALANGAIVVAESTYGGTLPAAIVQYTQYTVAGLASDTFNVGQNTATTGNGMVRQITVQNVPSGVTVSFTGGAPGNLVLTAA